VIYTAFVKFFDHWVPKEISTEKQFFFLPRIPLQQNSTYPEAGYPDRLGPWGTSVDISKKLTRFEITGYRIKYSTVLWHLKLQIRRGRKV